MDWIPFVKKYAKEHSIKYSDALKKAGPEYRSQKKVKGTGNMFGKKKNKVYKDDDDVEEEETTDETNAKKKALEKFAGIKPKVEERPRAVTKTTPMPKTFDSSRKKKK